MVHMVHIESTTTIDPEPESVHMVHMVHIESTTTIDQWAWVMAQATFN